MSFFKRKEKTPSLAIPLPPDEAKGPPPKRTEAEARAELFGSAAPRQHAAAAQDPYASRTSRSVVNSDPYAAKAAQRPQEADPARAALFSGYNPAAITREPGPRRYGDVGVGEAGEGQQTQEEEDEDVEMIKRDMRGVKQESLGSTRNALRIAREAEETARGTLSKLGDQSEKIANTERHLDLAKAASSRADDKTDELRKLNRSIFIPVVTFNKDAKNRAREQRITDRHIEETADRQKARLDVEQTQRRLNDRSLGSGSRGPSAAHLAARKEGRQKYQFEATASDDELEDELDDNLDETLDVVKRLKVLALAGGEEIKSHNDRLTRINDKAEGLDLRIQHNNERLKRIR